MIQKCFLKKYVPLPKFFMELLELQFENIGPFKEGNISLRPDIEGTAPKQLIITGETELVNRLLLIR